MIGTRIATDDTDFYWKVRLLRVNHVSVVFSSLVPLR